MNKLLPSHVARNHGIMIRFCNVAPEEYFRRNKMYPIEKPVIKIDGDRLSTVVTLPESESTERVVILLHGGPEGSKDGPSDLFVKLSEAMADKGIATVRFDFRGQGESDGDYIEMTITRQQEEYLAVLSYAKENGFEKIGVIGESYGATSALGALTDDVAVLGLLWPAIYLLDETFAGLFSEEAQEELTLNGYIQQGEDRIGREFLAELIAVDNVEEGVRRIKVPVMLIHGDQDSEVPYRQSEKAYDLVSEPKELIIVPGGDHCLRQPHEQELVIEKMTEWFDKYL